MKILITIVFLLSVPYHAQSSEDLCKIYDNATQLSKKKLEDGVWFTYKEVKLIKYYIEKEYYSTDEKLSSMNDIRSYFKDQHDELSLTVLISKGYKTKLTFIKSYPGDNPSGFFFNEKGEHVGQNSDDSISFHGKYCDL